MDKDKEKENLYVLLDEILAYIQSGISTEVIRQCNGNELSWMYRARDTVKKWDGSKLSELTVDR